jgi:hypothetical protein
MNNRSRTLLLLMASLLMVSALPAAAEKKVESKTFAWTSDDEKEIKVEVVVEDGEKVVKVFEIVDGEPQLIKEMSGENAHDFDMGEGHVFVIGEDGNKCSPHANAKTCGTHAAPMHKIKMMKEHAFFSEPRAYLGIQMEDLTGQLADYFGGEGVLVKEVIEDSPAADAGLKAGDVVIKINDEDITTGQDIVTVMGDHDQGDQVKVKVRRKGKGKTIKVTLGENDSDSMANVWFDQDHGSAHAFHFPEGKGNMHFMPDMESGDHQVIMRRIHEDSTGELENLKADVAELKALVEELQNK